MDFLSTVLLSFKQTHISRQTEMFMSKLYKNENYIYSEN